jgi:hypothetical protein
MISLIAVILSVEIAFITAVGIPYLAAKLKERRWHPQ